MTDLNLEEVSKNLLETMEDSGVPIFKHPTVQAAYTSTLLSNMVVFEAPFYLLTAPIIWFAWFDLGNNMTPYNIFMMAL